MNGDLEMSNELSLQTNAAPHSLHHPKLRQKEKTMAEDEVRQLLRYPLSRSKYPSFK